MSRSHNQTGFGLLPLLLVVVVLGAVAVIGLRVAGNSGGSAASKVSSTANVPDKISSKADVTQAGKALDATDVDEGVNPSQLDSDLNSLL